MSDTSTVEPADLIRRLRRLATTRGWVIRVEEGGSHTKITPNGRRSTVPRHAKDMGTGLLQAIRKQLGLLPESLT